MSMPSSRLHHSEISRADSIQRPRFLPKIYRIYLVLQQTPTYHSVNPAKSPTIAFVNTLRRLFFGTSPVSPAAMANAKSKAQDIIDKNNVVVFSKSYCPYCKATKSLLSEKGAKYFLMELDQVCESTMFLQCLPEIVC